MEFREGAFDFQTSQQNHKYETTLKENVFLNVDAESDDLSYYQLLKENIGLTLPESDLQSQLGFWFNNGHQLSGGQWIKIAIIRAFIRKPSLLLLDEPNSSLDNIAELKLMETIRNESLSREMLTLIISHRLRNLRKLNSLIIFLEDGKIDDVGTFEKMLDNDGFRELYESEV